MGRAGAAHEPVVDAAAVAAVSEELVGVVPPGARVVLAVSGGGDSTGMAHLVRAARPDLAGLVVHVRHGLRDDEADARAAVAHATALSLPSRVMEVTVSPDGTGPENAARTARLAALIQAAAEHGAGFVFTGHTADDSAETMLLNIARGTGLAGLAGIPAVRTLAPGVLVVRPVLHLRRGVVRAVAAATGLAFVEDPTNDDPGQRRARARRTLLPLLQELTGADTDAVTALQRLASHARSDTAALDTIAAAESRRLMQRWGAVATASRNALSCMPVALAHRIIRNMIVVAGGPEAASEAAVVAVLRLTDGQAVTLPSGIVATAGAGQIAVGPAGAGLPVRQMTGPELAVPEIDVVIRREPAAAAAAGNALPPWAPAAAAAAVPVSRTAPLVVRSRQPGDRIATAGGTQTIADAMIDAGVPRLARNLVPVIADDDGPLWVPGVAVRAGASGELRLSLTPALGPARDQ